MSRARTARTRPRDGGSVTLELAILCPVLLGLLGFMVVAGRVAVANNTVTTVAGNAARQASLARNATAAAAAASSSARAQLAAQAVRCQDGGAVAVDVSGFTAAAHGVPNQAVVVTVTCLVSFSDLAIPGLPGSRTLTDQAVSPIDPNRGTASPAGPP